MSNTREITIQGLEFTVSTPYAAGHVITEGEAAALNQTRCENIRNNQSRFIKAALDAAGTDANGEQNPLTPETVSELVAGVNKYDSEYEFTVANVGRGRTPVDPIEKEAIRLAKLTVTAMLRKKGTTVKAYTESAEGADKYEDAVQTLATSDEYIKAAKKAVADRAKRADAGMESLNLL